MTTEKNPMTTYPSEQDDEVDDDETASDLYLFVWCNEGLEFLFNITEHEKKNTWMALKGLPPNPLPFSLSSLILRAHVNAQRFYEIYSLNVARSITKEDLESHFETNPQEIANLIRQKGRNIFGEPMNPGRVKITRS